MLRQPLGNASSGEEHLTLYATSRLRLKPVPDTASSQLLGQRIPITRVNALKVQR